MRSSVLYSEEEFEEFLQELQDTNPSCILYVRENIDSPKSYPSICLITSEYDAKSGIVYLNPSCIDLEYFGPYKECIRALEKELAYKDGYYSIGPMDDSPGSKVEMLKVLANNLNKVK